jgi:protein O-GlcNAc transferase
VKSSALEHDDERAGFAARARAHGIEPARLELRGYSSHLDMLAQYNDVDLVLDTFPYNGGITTLEALWMGRPVVTMRGDTLISRQSSALLDAIGLGELVAANVEEFAMIAADFSRDAARLDELAATLRGRMRASPLFDAKGLAQALEATYRSLWRRWMETP